MHVRAQPDKLGVPVEVFRLRNLVVYDDFDQAILIVQKLEQGQILTTQVSDPNFKKIAEGLGIGLNATHKVLQK